MTPKRADETAGKAGDEPYEIKQLRVQDVPARLRPRELVETCGVEAVEPYVLLAVILRSGARGANVIDLSRTLLQKYASLKDLTCASEAELRKIKGLGRVKVQVLKCALELARRVSAEGTEKTSHIRTPEDAAKILREDARMLEKEVFWVLLLNARNGLIRRPVTITQGLVDSSLVHAREVFQEAIRSSAVSVVLVHNHPSGDPTPSAEDIRITRKLVQAGHVVDIRVVDHVILGKRSPDRDADYISLSAAGLVDFS